MNYFLFDLEYRIVRWDILRIEDVASKIWVVWKAHFGKVGARKLPSCVYEVVSGPDPDDDNVWSILGPSLGKVFY